MRVLLRSAVWDDIASNWIRSCRVFVSEITILLLYLAAAAAFGASRLPRYSSKAHLLFLVACASVAIGVTMHSRTLYGSILVGEGFNLSLGNTVSMIGLELAIIALIAALEPTLRGISAGLLLLGAIAAAMTVREDSPITMAVLAWQLRAHILVSLMSYGLLTVGAIVAIYAIVQERRLQAGRLSTVSSLFAPLETTEKLLFGIAAAGFGGLVLAISSGLTFVDDLFAQHLAHKTAFSILALFVFGILLAGRFFAGWRGRHAIKLYLGGFGLLCVAYFGVRLILEIGFDRSWG
jgi:ABC-type uncharacterized transport system permease subunit